MASGIPCRKAAEATAAAKLSPTAETSATNSSPALHFLRRPHSIDVLVPDRFAFHEAFPQVTCDRTTLEDYMTLMLKGEIL